MSIVGTVAVHIAIISERLLNPLKSDRQILSGVNASLENPLNEKVCVRQFFWILHRL